MTIIVYRQGIIAADTMISANGSRCGHALKLVRHFDWLIGGAGNVGCAIPVVRWISEGCDFSKPVDFGKFDASVILVDPDGNLFNTDSGSGYVIPEVAPYACTGSGADVARGAMVVGANAIRAVQAALITETSCGGKVVWMSRDGTEDIDLPLEICPAVM